MKFFQKIIGAKGPIKLLSLLTTVSLEVQSMCFLTRSHGHSAKRLRSCSETDLTSHGGNSDSKNVDMTVNKTFWRRSVGLLSPDALLANDMDIKSYVPGADNQDKGSVHTSQPFKYCQSSQLILVNQHHLSNTIGQDIVLHPSPPQMTSTVTTTSSIRDKRRSNSISLNQKQHQKFPDESEEASKPIPAVSTPVHSASPAPNGYPFQYSDPCASTAQSFGVKIRDFAFEAHGAKTARVVTMEDSLKFKYTKCRAAHQAPPEDLLKDLWYYVREWLEEAEKRPDEWFIVEDSDD